MISRICIQILNDLNRSIRRKFKWTSGHLKVMYCLQATIIQFKQFSVVLSHSFRLHSNRFEIFTCLQETIIQSKQEKTFKQIFSRECYQEYLYNIQEEGLTG